MKAWMIGVVAMALALTGCGGSEISENEASEIAALSQDAGTHRAAFARAIRELGEKKGCQADYMADQGGFSRDSGGRYYFIHCGTLYSESNIQTWYYSPSLDRLTRFESEL